METPWLLASVPALIALNAFFVASEYALVAARPVHLDSLRKHGRRRSAAALQGLKAHTADALGTIQVCITVTNLALGWLGEPAMTALLTTALGSVAASIPDAVFRPVSIGLSFFVVTLLTVVFSELLPKALSLRYVELAALLTAVPVRGIGFVVRPVVALMNAMANAVTRPLGLGRVQDMEHEGVSADELRILTLEAARAGVLTPKEQHLITSTLTLNKRLARQIMVPRTQVVYLDLQRSMEENRRLMNERLLSRLPLCDGGLDHVLGVIHVKRFLAAYHAEGDVSVLQLIADEAVFVPDSISVAGLIATFSEKHTEFVILADEYGGAAGIVTLKDVIDELLGVVDESKMLLADALKSQTPGGPPRRRVVRGDLPIHELARSIGHPDWGQGESVTTVAGLIQAHLGQVGRVGDEAEIDGVRLKVVKADSRAIRRVEVTPLPPPSPPA